MGSKREGAAKASKPSLESPNKTDIAKNKKKNTFDTKKKKKKKQKLSETNDNYDDRVEEQNDIDENHNNDVVQASASTQLRLFLDHFQSANGVQLSSLELESIKDTCILDLSRCTDEDSNSLGKDMKAAFGLPWKEVLCGNRLLEGKVDPGSPAILIVSLSAMRSIELLRGLRSLTKQCAAVKLFSKHMKVEDQVVHSGICEMMTPYRLRHWRC